MLLSLITLSLRYSGLGADFINQEMAYFAYISFGVTALNMVMEYIFLSEGEEPRGLNILNWWRDVKAGVLF